MKKSALIVGAAVWVSCFLLFLGRVMGNLGSIETDEMYWISTSDSLYRILRGDFSSRLWHENYGFANLNGAKFVYGAGLMLLGQTDLSGIGTGSETYFIWKDYGGSPLPQDHPKYPLLRAGRTVSAFFASLGMVLVYFCAFVLTGSLTAALLAAAVTAFYPVTLHIAQLALADSIFLFFQMAVLFLLVLRRREKKDTPLLDCLTGIAFAWLVSVKMNGFLFLPVILLMSLPFDDDRDGTYAVRLFAYRTLRTMTAAVVTFLMIHPNFFFYPEYSLVDIYRDRVYITMNHIGFFSQADPEHVTLAYDLRLASLVRHVFRIWMLPLNLLTLIPLGMRIGTGRLTKSEILWMFTALITAVVILAYTVFDEQRYYYPLVPILGVIVGFSWFPLPAGSGTVRRVRHP